MKWYFCQIKENTMSENIRHLITIFAGAERVVFDLFEYPCYKSLAENWQAMCFI